MWFLLTNIQLVNVDNIDFIKTYFIQFPCFLVDVEDSSINQIYVYLDIKENSITMYGFGHIMALQLFMQLIKINKVGCKSAYKMINTLTYHGLVSAIVNRNEALIATVPLISRKIASNIILSMEDSIGHYQQSGYGMDSVIAALNALNVPQQQINEILNAVSQLTFETEDDLLRCALGMLG